MNRITLATLLCLLGSPALAVCPSPLTGKDAAGTTQNFGVTVDGSGNCYGNVGIVDGSAAANKASVSAAGALKVDGSAVTQPISGSVTVTQGTAANLNATVTGTVAATQSGTWTVQQGSAPWPIVGDTASGASNAGNPVKVGGAFNTTQPTVTTGQTVDAQYTARGAAIVATGIDPFSATVTGTVTANAGSGTFTVGGTVTANQGGAPWSENITQFGGVALSTGTGAGGTGIPRVTVSNDSNVLATQSGTWTVQQGTPPWSVSQSGNWTNRIVGNAGGILDAAGQNASSPANELLTACQFNTSPTTITSGNISPVQCNNAGALNVAIVSGGGSGGTASSFGAAFPATGTAIGVKNGSNMVNLTADGSGNLDVNCQSGCAGASDHTGTGTVTAVNNAVTVSTVGVGDVTAVVTADTNVTLIFEGTVDGSNWVTLNAYPLGGGASVTTTNANGSWAVPAGGLNEVRTRVTAVGSTPTATVSLNAGAGSTQPNVVVNPTAANLNATVVQGTTPWVDNITQFGSTNISTGTGASGAGIPRVTVSNDSNVLATQSGSWTVTANAGTNLNTSALALDTSVNGILLSQGSTTSGEKGPIVQGAVTTNAPSYTTAQTSPLSLDTSGLLRLSIKDTPANTNNLNVNVAASGVTLSDNVTQFGGTNISTGTGAGGTGIPRVTVSNDSQVKIWDGTSTNTLKASGTNAATTDTAIVVAPSPNPSDVCTSFKAISQTASTDLITSTNKLHICAMLIVSATAQSVSLVEGTGTTCATGGTAIMGSTTVANGMALAANGGFSHTADRPFLVTGTTADHLCLLQSGAGNVSGFISYVDHN